MLGIKTLIAEHEHGDEDIAINKIEKIRKIVDSSTNILKKSESVEYIHISDSFVFVSDPKTIISILKLLSTIQIRIVYECHRLLRGAITIGDAIIENEGKYIIGPAYIQAYKLQENDAIFPRIIVDNSVINAIKKSDKEIKDFLKQDFDKEFFIDYIKVFMKEDESLTEQNLKIKFSRNRVFDKLDEEYKKFNKKEEHDICQKYGWTIQYYKSKGVWRNG